MSDKQLTDYKTKGENPPTIHAALVEKYSAPLHAMMSNGHMVESITGVPVLEDVEEEIFAAFYEHAYIGKFVKQYMDEYDEVMLVETPKSDPEAHQRFSTLSPIISQDQILRFYHLKRFGETTWSSPNNGILFYAKLYIFAPKYLIDSMYEWCLSAFYETLMPREPEELPVYDLIDLVYSQTGRFDPNGGSPLRKIVIRYVVMCLPTLIESGNFVPLLDSHAEFGSDLLMHFFHVPDPSNSSRKRRKT